MWVWLPWVGVVLALGALAMVVRIAHRRRP
jgi:hypothetical protein